MKITNKSFSNDYVTKRNLNLVIEKQNKDVNQMFEKQSKSVNQMFERQSKDFNQKLKQQTQDFTNLVHEILIEVGIKFGGQDRKFEKIDIKLEKHDHKFDQLSKEMRNLEKKLLDSNLQIIEELRAIRQEQPLLSYRQQKNTDQLRKHNTRISILEKNYQANL